MARVKSASPLLIFLAAVALCGCHTMSNRRDMFTATPASGPYTEALNTGSWRKGEYPVAKAREEDKRAAMPVLTSEEPAPAPKPAKP